MDNILYDIQKYISDDQAFRQERFVRNVNIQQNFSP
jgi:hypothetical protein